MRNAKLTIYHLSLIILSLLFIGGCFEEPTPAYKTVDSARRVYLNDRGLETLPEINTKADYLNLDRNRLSSVDKIAELTELKWLRLNENRLSKLPDLSKSVKLRRIYLRGNRFTEVPSTLENLPALDSIDLSDNPISEVPDFLVRKPNLHHLDLSRTKITKLPEDLSAWKSLRSLQLGELDLKYEEMHRIRKALKDVVVIF